MKPETATVIALPAPPAEPANVSLELQQLWFTLAAQRWTALLIVPAPGAGSPLSLATELAQIARRAGLEPRTSLLDGTRVTLDQTAALASQIAARVDKQERVLVAVDRIDENPAALALASRCDAAVLCVRLGQSSLAAARETLERCGRPRFLGSVVLR